jgi:hypothetical protein
VSEVKISKTMKNGRWWSDVIMIGDRFWPCDRQETDKYEDKLKFMGWIEVSKEEIDDRSVSVWRIA